MARGRRHHDRNAIGQPRTITMCMLRAWLRARMARGAAVVVERRLAAVARGIA
jgi:hypothetical protein